MAEAGSEQTCSQTSPWSSKVLCRYFLHGVCRYGSQCPYSHNRSDKPSNVCTFYLKGTCTYGDKCRYDHVKPKKDLDSHMHVEHGRNGNIIKPVPIIDTRPHRGNMVKLTKSKQPTTPVSPPFKPAEDWVKATEFVPGQPYVCSSVPASYSKAVGDTAEDSPFSSLATNPADFINTNDTAPLCPYFMQGQCPYEEKCVYLHGDICEFCGLPVLHPSDEDQREQHHSECVKQHEKDMELSFAVARSRDKACGICMDVIMEKHPPTERRFGIMSNCNHTFCLTCIRKWRGARQFESTIVRACPECRVKSDFITPSQYWVETEEEKGKLIQGYKKALSSKPCKYFKEGSGECPFNDKCFYKHTLPDGSLAQPKPPRRRRRQNADGDTDIIQRINLWDFLEERQNRSLLLELEAELDSLLFQIFSSDTDSDSDFDGFW